MSLESGPRETGQSLSPLDRARLLSEALSDAARRARFSTRSRRFVKGGFQGRSGQGLFYWFSVVTFVLMVAIPSLFVAGYYGFLASDQYLAEFKFTVAGSEAPVTDGIGVITGLPAMSIIQDTQIVANHLESRAAVEALEAKVQLRARYSGESIDWFARFNPEKPIEKLVRYWKSMSDVAIVMPAGIVDVRIRAFSPDDAQQIAQAVIAISETLINDLNDRMNRDALQTAEAEVARASQRLSNARLEMQKARNDEGILDVTRTADAVGKLLTEMRSGLLQLQQEYQTQLRSVTEKAPQMVALKARINATSQQIAEIEAQLTQKGLDGAGGATLSRSITRFAELDLERQISERLYAGAIGALELARINAERKKMYLNTFVEPLRPQEPRYPKRILWTLLFILGALAAWGAVVGTTATIRNHMA